MMKSILTMIAAACAVAFLLPVASAHADERVWRVTAQEGQVRIQQPGREFSDATLNSALPSGTSVTTGGASRAVLENGAQRITIGANSRMTIAADSSDAMTRILEQFGAILFQVDHRGAQHFRVETPLLAAVVKGTTFTVSAAPEQDMVHVAQGLVEVIANDGGASQDAPSGATVRVTRDQPTSVGAVTASLTPQDSATTLDIAPIDYADASQGLVMSASAAAGGLATAATHASASAGGANANVNANVGSLNANANASVGGSGVSANANAGGLAGVSASAGTSGVTAGVNVGGVAGAGVSAGSGGVNVGVNVGGLNVNLGLGTH